MKICKRFRFDAAHRLPRHDGPCSRTHGHGYFLEVEISGHPYVSSPIPQQGMVVDFSLLKMIVETRIMSICDHRDLNQAVRGYGVTRDAEIENVTTAENLVALFADTLKEGVASLGVMHLSRVRLHETPDSWAEWEHGEDLSRILRYLRGGA